MPHAMLFSMALFIAVSLLLIGLALPLMRRRVKPNALYGLRVPATLADEWVWYEANARSGRDLLLLGLMELGLSLLLPFAPGVTEEACALGLAGFLTLGTLASCILGWKRANRLLADRRRLSSHPA